MQIIILYNFKSEQTVFTLTAIDLKMCALYDRYPAKKSTITFINELFYDDKPIKITIKRSFNNFQLRYRLILILIENYFRICLHLDWSNNLDILYPKIVHNEYDLA